MQPFLHTCTYWYIDTLVYIYIYNYIDTLVQHYLPLLQLHFNFRDFNDGICHVMKISTPKSNPDTGLFTQRAFCFSPNKTSITIVSSPKKMPITAVSAASDWGKFCVLVSFVFLSRAQHRLPEAGPASTLSGALFFGGGGGGREAAGTGQRAFAPSAAHHLQPAAAGAGDRATDGAAPA